MGDTDRAKGKSSVTRPGPVGVEDELPVSRRRGEDKETSHVGTSTSFTFVLYLIQVSHIV